MFLDFNCRNRKNTGGQTKNILLEFRFLIECRRWGTDGLREKPSGEQLIHLQHHPRPGGYIEA